MSVNILWLPHAPLSASRTRSDHLIERLAQRHQLTVVDFQVHPASELWRYVTDLFTHRSGRGLLYSRLAVWRFPRAGRLNGWLLNRIVQSELKRGKYDVLVVAPAPYLTGYLDFSALRGRVAVVCDYLDGADWAQVYDATAFERLYVASADAVMCVSHGLQRQAMSLNPRSYYVPNGVELSRYRAFRESHTTRGCKALLGIDPDARVVSIIGMTCSARLYFVDAVVSLARKGRNVVLLLVGNSPLLERIRLRDPTSGVVRAVGAVPYEDILAYYMASDLGLYAVDDDPYYHFASPLKVFEYVAMGKPVLVSPWLREVARIGLSNVAFCDADTESVTSHIERMIDACDSVTAATLDNYDWDEIVRQVEGILSATIRERADRGDASITAHRSSHASSDVDRHATGSH